METNAESETSYYTIHSDIGIERTFEAWGSISGDAVHMIVSDDGHHVKYVFPRSEFEALAGALGVGQSADSEVRRELAEAKAKLEKFAELAKEVRKSAATYAQPSTPQKTTDISKHILLSDVATRIEETLSGISLESLSELGVGSGVVGVVKEDAAFTEWAGTTLRKGQREELRRFSNGFWHTDKSRLKLTDAQVGRYYEVVEVL